MTHDEQTEPTGFTEIRPAFSFERLKALAPRLGVVYARNIRKARWASRYRRRYERGRR